MATLNDVAREAGVSTATVSRYFNDPDMVTPKTRAVVEQAVEALGYRPSRVARRLRVEKGQAHLIGLVIPDMQNPFFVDIVRGVEDVAYSHGYAVILCNSDESAEREKLSLDLLRSESVDGLIVPTVRRGNATAEELTRDGVPVVCVDRRPAKIIVDTVISDNEQGALEAVEHLLELGHRRIGYVGGIPHISTSTERLAGYRKALEAANVPFEPGLVREGDSRQESGRAMAGQLLDLSEPPSALFVGNNLMTLGALEAIHRRDLTIPDDVALVSYDDMPWSLAFDPPLTAVSQPGYEMGREAAELLLRRIEEPGESAQLVVLQPRLLIRGSCGARQSTAA